MKDSEGKRMGLIRDNLALHNKLKESQEVEDHSHHDPASLRKSLSPELNLEVRILVALRELKGMCCTVYDPNFLTV